MKTHILHYLSTGLHHSATVCHHQQSCWKLRKYCALLPTRTLAQREREERNREVMMQSMQLRQNNPKATTTQPELQGFKPDDPVSIQLNLHRSKWIKDTVIELLYENTSGCSYKIQTETGGVYIRNEKFIKPGKDNKIQEIVDQTTHIQQQQRPTRPMKKPNRLKEELLNHTTITIVNKHGTLWLAGCWLTGQPFVQKSNESVLISHCKVVKQLTLRQGLLILREGGDVIRYHHEFQLFHFINKFQHFEYL